VQRGKGAGIAADVADGPEVVAGAVAPAVDEVAGAAEATAEEDTKVLAADSRRSRPRKKIRPR